MDEKRVTGEAKKLGGKVESAVGDLTGDRETKAEGKTTELKGTAENIVGQAKDAVGDAAAQALDAAQDTLEHVRQRYPDAERVYRRGAAAARRHTQESPLGAILVAGIIGYLLALLLRSRR